MADEEDGLVLNVGVLATSTARRSAAVAPSRSAAATAAARRRSLAAGTSSFPSVPTKPLATHVSALKKRKRDEKGAKPSEVAVAPPELLPPASSSPTISTRLASDVIVSEGRHAAPASISHDTGTETAASAHERPARPSAAASFSLRAIRDGTWSQQERERHKEKMKQRYSKSIPSSAVAAQTEQQNPSAPLSASAEPSYTSENPIPAPKRRKLADIQSVEETATPAPVAATVAAPGARLFSEATSFDEFGLESHLLQNLVHVMGHSRPTEVQSASLSGLLANHRDAMIKAPTGSGKTLAYLIPVVQGLVTAVPKIDRSTGTRAVVIAPTRELCMQIYLVLQKLLRPFPNVVPGAIMGGEKRKSEKARLRKGIAVLVSTPGRLLDHLRNTNSFQLASLEWIVYDEADRLLDMGFEPDVRQILHLIQSKRPQNSMNLRSLLCSATLNEQVGRLVDIALAEPLFINVSQGPVAQPSLENPPDANTTDPETNLDDDLEVVPVEGESDAEDTSNGHETSPSPSAGRDAADEELEREHAIPSQLRQHYVVCPAKRKLVTLAAFLRWKLLSHKEMKAIVFLSNCDSVEFLYALFSTVELPVHPPGAKRRRHQEDADDAQPLFPCNLFKLHGSLSQQVRSSTFTAFSKCDRGILFATDVAARGIDIPHVSWIIQYDVPADPAAYIHRIGRTARIGTEGDALLMLIDSERPYVDILKARKSMVMNELLPETVLSKLRTNLERIDRSDGAREASALQHLMEQIVTASTGTDFKRLAVKAYQSFLRSYATHAKGTKHIFHIKNIHLGHLARNFALVDPPSKFKELIQGEMEAIKKKKELTKGRNLKVYRTESPTDVLPGIGSFAAKYMGKAGATQKTMRRLAFKGADMSAEFAAGI